MAKETVLEQSELCGIVGHISSNYQNNRNNLKIATDTLCIEGQITLESGGLKMARLVSLTGDFQ